MLLGGGGGGGGGRRGGAGRAYLDHYCAFLVCKKILISIYCHFKSHVSDHLRGGGVGGRVLIVRLGISYHKGRKRIEEFSTQSEEGTIQLLLVSPISCAAESC